MVKYAPGYRFFPTDEELIIEYLMKKIENQPIPIDIAVVNFNDHNPDTLSGAYPPLVENEWYFFTLRNRKHQNGSRPDRSTPDGFWKATAADKPVTDSNGVIVGSKRSLKFFEGTPSNKPIKTDWIMHEFIAAAADQPSRNKRDANDNMKLDDLVLCRIHKRTAKLDNNRGLPSDHRPPLAVPAPHVDLSSDYMPASNLSLSDEEQWTIVFDGLWSNGEQEPVAQVEGVSSSEFAIAEQWRSVIEVLMTEDEQEPEGVSPSEVAAKVEYWRKVWEGSPTEVEDQQQQQQDPQNNYNIGPCSPPHKRVRHFYQLF